MVMYDHYTVLGAKIKVQFHNSDATYEQLVGITLIDDVIASNDPTVLIENGNSTWRTLGQENKSSSHAVLSKGWSARKYFSKNVMNDHSFAGNIAVNPDEMANFMIWAAPMYNVDSQPVRILVQIEYFALLSEPKELGQS